MTSSYPAAHTVPWDQPLAKEPGFWGRQWARIYNWLTRTANEGSNERDRLHTPGGN